MADPGKDRVRDWFGRHAAAYARNESQRAGPDLRRLVEVLEPTPSERALDVGTAAGHTALALAPLVAEVVGLDLTPAMQAQFEEGARKRGAINARFQVGDVDALPFPDRSFDLVTCRRAVHHFPDPAAAIGEIARVLRPGGRLGLADMVAPAEPDAAALCNALEKARDGSHVRALPPEELRSVVEGAGLRVASLDLLPERVPWESWLSPVSPGGAEDAQARRVAAEAPPGPRALVVEDGPGGRFFLKTRVVILARRVPTGAR